MVNRDVYPQAHPAGKENRFANYSRWMSDFIRDVRTDLRASKMPLVIGVMGVGGEIDDKYGQVRQMGYLLRTKNKHHANRDGTMSNQQQREYLKKLEADLISPEEAALRRRGASNAGYHYLGCAKTFALMGKAYAEALIEMQEK